MSNTLDSSGGVRERVVVERRRTPPGGFCPTCSEFVHERWGIVQAGRRVYLCWSGHRWNDRRRPA